MPWRPGKNVLCVCLLSLVSFVTFRGDLGAPLPPHSLPCAISLAHPDSSISEGQLWSFRAQTPLQTHFQTVESLECALRLQEADAGSEGPSEATEMVCRACYPRPQDLIGKRTAKQGLVCSRHFPSGMELLGSGWAGQGWAGLGKTKDFQYPYLNVQRNKDTQNLNGWLSAVRHRTWGQLCRFKDNSPG